MPINSPNRKVSDLKLWIIEDSDLEDAVWSARKFTRRDLVLNISSLDLRKGPGVWADMQPMIEASAVKEYSAILFQSGTDAPLASGVYKQLPGTASYGYQGQGDYTLTLTGAFPEERTKVFIQNGIGLPATASIEAYRLDDNTISIKTTDAGVGTDGYLYNASLWVRVDPVPET